MKLEKTLTNMDKRSDSKGELPDIIGLLRERIELLKQKMELLEKIRIKTLLITIKRLTIDAMPFGEELTESQVIDGVFSASEIGDLDSLKSILKYSGYNVENLTQKRRKVNDDYICYKERTGYVAHILDRPDQHEVDPGFTLLEFAAYYGHKDVAIFLVIHGKAQITFQSCLNAMRRKHLPMLSFLLLQFKQSLDFLGGLLSVATGNGDDEAIKILVTAGANVNRYFLLNDRNPVIKYDPESAEAGKDNPSYLGTAIELGYQSTVSTLLEFKANINFLSDGDTPFWLAAFRNNQSGIVKILMEAKADINTFSSNWKVEGSPIYYFAKYGNSRAVFTLLDAGAKTDRVINPGCIKFADMRIGQSNLKRFEKQYKIANLILSTGFFSDKPLPRLIAEYAVEDDLESSQGEGPLLTV